MGHPLEHAVVHRHRSVIEKFMQTAVVNCPVLGVQVHDKIAVPALYALDPGHTPVIYLGLSGSSVQTLRV